MRKIFDQEEFQVPKVGSFFLRPPFFLVYFHLRKPICQDELRIEEGLNRLLKSCSGIVISDLSEDPKIMSHRDFISSMD